MPRIKLLFTPGPLTTSRTVKAAMMRDLGSRDAQFIQMIRDIRARLLALGQVSAPEYGTILMPGSGTNGIEAVVSSTIPRSGKVLVAINGAYGRRIAQIAETLTIDVATITVEENCKITPEAVDRALAADAAITDVAVVHCETTSGILNPVTEIGAVVKRHGRRYFVDAMSSFGGIPLNVDAAHIDYLVSSANKCVQGVPGFSFVLARRATLEATAGYARSLSMNLLAQFQGLETDGQFRFTPPTHALLAFHQALNELDAEGGVHARAVRYESNHQLLVAGMRALGFGEYLAPVDQGPIITSFRYPADPKFDFKTFYQRLSDLGCVIYPGKLTSADCFRIGHIGHLGAREINTLLTAVRTTVHDLGLQMRA